MKLNDMIATQIKTELKKVSDDCFINCKYCHENKRYMALLNEYERRVMGHN